MFECVLLTLKLTSVGEEGVEEEELSENEKVGDGGWATTRGCCEDEAVPEIETVSIAGSDNEA